MAESGPLNRPAAIVYDHDGTLVDSIAVVEAATNATLRARGFATCTRSQITRGMVLHTAERMGHHAGVAEPALQRAMAQDFYAQALVQVDRATAYPGIATMLGRIRTLGIPQGLVSNNQGIFVRACLPRVGLMPYLYPGAVLGEEDMPAPKPDPRGVLAVLRTLDADPARSWYVGDASTDLHLARAAGMTAIGVTWGTTPRAQLATMGFDALVDAPEQLAELLPES